MSEPRNETGPRARVAAVEPEVSVLPLRLIAEHADFASVRSPNGEARAVNAIDAVEVCSKVLIHRRLFSVRVRDRPGGFPQRPAQMPSRWILPPGHGCLTAS